MKSFFLAVSFALAASPALAQSTFHANVARTGVYDSAGPSALAGVKWAFEAGGGILASPAIADGVVFVGALDGHLYAIDEETGKERWSFESSRPIASSAAVADGTVYFVSSAGSLVALDAATGKAKWAFADEYERRFQAKGLHGYGPEAQTIPDAWDVFTSSPAVADGTVYFGSGDGNVYAVDAATGLLQWKFPTGDVVHASPSVADGVVYVGSWDGNLYALDGATGQERWRFEAGRDPAIHNQQGFQSSAAIVDGVVYTGCRDGHVYALDAKTGRKKWDYPTSKSWVNTTPAVRDDVVYAATSDSKRFMALDAKTGRLRFNVDVKALVFSSPALAGRFAYFGSHNGILHAVDLAKGTVAWEFRTDASKADPLKLLDDQARSRRAAFFPVFHDFGDMYVHFYRYASLGAILSSPAVDKGVVFVGSLDGHLYALH